MKTFRHYDARSEEDALAMLSHFGNRATLLAGGTDLLGILKTEVRDDYPEAVINLKTVAGMDKIQFDSGILHIGAMARLADITTSSKLKEVFPIIADAAASVGSPELRNMATIGGNLCQDTRCWYYRYPDQMGGSIPCYRKNKGACHAIAGDNRYHAIFNGKKCYAVCPSDMATALAAMDARLIIKGPQGRRTVNIEDFYDIFGPKLETNDIVTRIDIFLSGTENRQKFLKFRLREAIDFAVVSVAVYLSMSCGICRTASIVLGGVAPTPLRVDAAEEIVKGKPINESIAAKAAEAAVAGAKPLSKNGYKVDLTRTLVRRALLDSKAP